MECTSGSPLSVICDILVCLKRLLKFIHVYTPQNDTQEQINTVLTLLSQYLHSRKPH